MTTLNNARPPRAARPRAETAVRQPPGRDPAARPALPPAQVPPAWGWKIPLAGRAAHVTAAPEYQATTTQVCGLYPYVAGAGTPAAGTPVGRHQLWGEVVCRSFSASPVSARARWSSGRSPGPWRLVPGSWSSVTPNPTTPC